MPKLTLKDLLELAGEQARTVLIEKGSSLMPTWLLIDRKGRMMIVGTPWQDDLEKKMAELAMRRFMREHKIVTYSFVVEAWMATKPPGWSPEADPNYVRPAKDPDRREVVMALATDGKAMEARTWAIRRDYLEKISGLEPLKPEEEMERGKLFGWMTELLK